MPEDINPHEGAGVATGAGEKAREGPSPADIAYPPRLKAEEYKLTRRRPKWTSRDTKKKPSEVGIALSGGGIRSATFCLGVFQALAQRKLLGQIDYISSVSGGSYFAAFYGRLFSRPDIANASNPSSALEEIEKILSPDEKTRLAFPEVVAWKRGIFGWLRENGRYLAPKGGGDVLIGVAVTLRNWLTVQVIMAAVVLTLLVLAQLLRFIGAGVLLKTCGWVMPPLSSGAFWWSPYVIVAVAMWFLLVAPSGWAYWMLPQGERWGGGFFSKLTDSIWSVLTSILVSGAAADLASRESGFKCFLLWLLAAGILPALFFWGWALTKFPTRANTPDAWQFQSEGARNFLSRVTRTTLVATAALLAFGLIDSLGQTIYAARFSSGHYFFSWLSGLYAMSALVAPFAQWAASALMPKTKGRHITIPMSVLAGFGAAVVILPVLIALDGLSHAIAYDFAAPEDAPSVLMSPPKPAYEVSLSLSNLAIPSNATLKNPEGATQSSPPPLPKDHVPVRLGDVTVNYTGPSANAASNHGAKPCYFPLCASLFFLVIFSWLAGYERKNKNKKKSSRERGTSTVWMFLNRTSLHAIYTSRLIRSYLGASNRFRYGKDAAGVIDVMNGDDITQERYWIEPDVPYYQRGGPVHIVNSTLNETLSGQTQVEQRDRHGMGLAVGPAGMTAGVKHHAVYVKPFYGDKAKVKVYPEAKDDFRVFEYEPASSADSQNLADHLEVIREFKGEQLSLGNWTGVSGAAAATGMGYRTSLGLSLLLGFFNVRLGYWWDSGIVARESSENETPTTLVQTGSATDQIPASRFNHARKIWHRIKSCLGRQVGRKDTGSESQSTSKKKNKGPNFLVQWITERFQLQTYLVDEFLGRFHGPARQRWYLSDGGNFENLGGYELIRRRLPLIVVIDAGADPDYGFEDIANLVRKARLDFNAEITFLEGDALKDECKRRCMPPDIQKLYGGLDELRRGKWADEPRPGATTRQISFESGDILRYSLKYVALARIHYLDEEEGKYSDMILIKPTLIGEEPADILQYHQQRPSFPHEGTGDQFFDEAQWESYRRLGEHIGQKIFREPGAGGFLASASLKPPAPLEVRGGAFIP